MMIDVRGGTTICLTWADGLKADSSSGTEMRPGAQMPFRDSKFLAIPNGSFMS
jgi:hypothetical protein